MKAGALPTLGIKGRFTVYGAGLEPMSALVNSTFDRAGAANGGTPPKAAARPPGRDVTNGRNAAAPIRLSRPSSSEP